MKHIFYLIIVLIALVACKEKQHTKDSSGEEMGIDTINLSDDSLLTLVQYQTFQYFWDGAESNSGLACERVHMDGVYPKNDQDIITSGGSGFGLMAILVGIERGFITREQGLDRFEKILDFLETCDRFHGVYPHWWNGKTGKVQPFSKKDDGGDLVETSFLMQGLLTVRQYLKNGNEREKDIANRIDKLWREVEFNWHTKGGEKVLYWHWSPNYGWEMNFPVGGYNECLIMYILAASSPTFPIDAEVYDKGWALDGAIAKDTVYYDLNTILNFYEGNDAPTGPLFWAHYSYLGLNPKGLSDKYADYWTLNTNHTKIHYRYALDNPKGFSGYGEKQWGLTSSYSMKGYAGHRPGNDLGVISPTAAISSFPYTPEESMRFLRYLYTEADSLVGKFGPYDAYNQTTGWYVPHYLAIDQGPIPVMIENYRTGMFWDLFMSAPEVQTGLTKLGFKFSGYN